MSPFDKFLLTYALPTVFLCSIIEAVILSRSSRYDWKAMGVSSFDLFGRVAFNIDANYGGVLIIFDRLFGTYIEERDDLPCRYGLVRPLRSYNPLKVEFAQWLSLAKDLASARSVRAFLGYLFMPPGWKPDGAGETTRELRQRHAEANRIPAR